MGCTRIAVCLGLQVESVSTPPVQRSTDQRGWEVHTTGGPSPSSSASGNRQWRCSFLYGLLHRLLGLFTGAGWTPRPRLKCSPPAVTTGRPAAPHGADLSRISYTSGCRTSPFAADTRSSKAVLRCAAVVLTPYTSHFWVISEVERLVGELRCTRWSHENGHFTREDRCEGRVWKVGMSHFRLFVQFQAYMHTILSCTLPDDFPRFSRVRVGATAHLRSCVHYGQLFGGHIKRVEPPSLTARRAVQTKRDAAPGGSGWAGQAGRRSHQISSHGEQIDR